MDGPPGAIAEEEVDQCPLFRVGAIQFLGSGYCGGIIDGEDVVTTPHQRLRVAGFAAWFEDVHSIFCHAEHPPPLVIGRFCPVLRDRTRRVLRT
jgi:hypothetical protein